MQPAESYALQMVPQGRGHALYDPYPGQRVDATTGTLVRNPRVEIGDVGYISPRGSFHLLFNVHLQSDHPRQTHGVPRGFVPLQLVLAQLDYRVDPTPHVLHSNSSVAADLGLGVSAPLVGGASLNLNFEHKEGAALAYFDKHEVWNAQNKDHYKDYFRANHRSWTEFAHSLAIGLVLEDLIFVTGCDRTRAWGTLWSGSSSGGGGLSLEVQTAVGPEISLTGSVQWRNVHSAHTLAGPPRQELATSATEQLLLPGPSSHSLPLSPGLVADQCIFLRGFRGLKLFKGAPLRMKAAAGPDELPPDNDADQADLSAIYTPASEDSDGLNLVELPASSPKMGFSLLSQTLRIIADGLTTSSLDDDLILLHDDDIISLQPSPEHVVWNSWKNATNIRLQLSTYIQDWISPHLLAMRISSVAQETISPASQGSDETPAGTIQHLSNHAREVSAPKKRKSSATPYLVEKPSGGYKDVSTIIEGRLYLGNLTAAASVHAQVDRRITHILSVCLESIPAQAPQSGVVHMRIPVEDRRHSDILIWLPHACRFIDDALRSGGVVLVHGVHGLSRGATVMAAYLMWSRGMTPTEALDTLRRQREQIWPNAGFQEQLALFEMCHYMPSPQEGIYARWRRNLDRQISEQDHNKAS